MAQIITVSLEKPLPTALTHFVKLATGKALARESDRLDTAARSRGVISITSQLSESHESLAAQLREQGFDPSRMRLAAEQWFAASEGLKTVKALAEHVTGHMNNFKQPNPILRDLKAIEELLQIAESAGVRFHFTKANV